LTPDDVLRFVENFWMRDEAHIAVITYSPEDAHAVWAAILAFRRAHPRKCAAGITAFNRAKRAGVEQARQARSDPDRSRPGISLSTWQGAAVATHRVAVIEARGACLFRLIARDEHRVAMRPASARRCQRRQGRQRRRRPTKTTGDPDGPAEPPSRRRNLSSEVAS
jgi:hypothetical protein